MALTREIDARRKAGIQLVRNYKQTLSHRSYTALTHLNNSLAEDLLYALNLGREMMHDPEIGDLDWILKQSIECLSPPSLEKMYLLIMSKLGARNSKVRSLATDLAFNACYANEVELADIISLQEVLYPYQGKLDIAKLESKFQGLKQMISATTEIVETMYRFVAGLRHVPERREYYQPPIATLEHVKGGDCDDLSMLTCSLWESIGFETTLNVVPGHIFPGVKILVPYGAQGGHLLRMCNIAADTIPLLGEEFNMFRFSVGLCTGDEGLIEFKRLKQRWQRYYSEAESYTVPPVRFEEYIEPIQALGEMEYG